MGALALASCEFGHWPGCFLKQVGVSPTIRSGSGSAFFGELHGGIGFLVVVRGIEVFFIASSLIEANWVSHFGIFGPTGMAGEMPGFLHYGFRAVGTTVVPPNFPGSTLRPAVRLAGMQAYIVRGLRSPDWDRRVRRTHSFFVAYLGYASTVCTSSVARGGFPVAMRGHIKVLRTYVEYASCIGTFSGAGGWIPTGGNAAQRDHAVSPGIYCARSPVPRLGPPRPQDAFLLRRPSAIVAATASCMERVIGIGQMRKMGGCTDQARRAKERGTEPDGVISVLGRERFVWDVSAFHRLLCWSCAPIALHLLLWVVSFRGSGRCGWLSGKMVAIEIMSETFLFPPRVTSAPSLCTTRRS